MSLSGKELIVKIVKLGHIVRQQRSEGNLQSVVPPTIYGYMSFIRMAIAMPHMNFQQVALVTLLGNASNDDRHSITNIFTEVFGVLSIDDDPTMGGNLF